MTHTSSYPFFASLGGECELCLPRWWWIVGETDRSRSRLDLENSPLALSFSDLLSAFSLGTSLSELFSLCLARSLSLLPFFSYSFSVTFSTSRSAWARFNRLVRGEGERGSGEFDSACLGDLARLDRFSRSGDLVRWEELFLAGDFDLWELLRRPGDLSFRDWLLLWGDSRPLTGEADRSDECLAIDDI